MLPNFFIADAAKSATSSLNDYLRQHSDIYMSEVKEPHFFAWYRAYQKGIDSYEALFVDGTDFKVRGESSTGYMVFPNVIERIKSTIDDPRFILRNPVDRAYSHYWWLRGLGYESRTFKRAFLADKDKEPDPGNDFGGNYKYYYQYGLYGKWLKRYIDTFGIHKIHILTTEQLRINLLETINLCCTFLGVGTFSEIETIQSNKTVILRHAKAYRMLHDWLYSAKLNNFVNRIPLSSIRKILTLVKMYASQTEKILQKKGTYPKLGVDERRWIAGFYYEEIVRLRLLTGLSFNEWNTDFPQIQKKP